MKRHAEAELFNWFNKKDRMPLVIRGARQVGKSTLVKLFCQNYGLTLIEINLEIWQLSSIEKSKFEINDLLEEIQLYANKVITDKTVIFFDEIQESPKMLRLLRYFYEMHPEIAVIAAGSLLEIVLADEKFSFPVGRIEFYHLGPMTFFEFLEACNENILLEHIKAKRFSTAVHEKALGLFQKYLFIGGMPKAVLSYINKTSLVEIRNIQQQILQTYLADFPKYNQRIDFKRISRVFSSIATQVGKKVIYQNFDRESKSREIKRVIELLVDARIALPCVHSNASKVPLLAGKDESIFKLFFIDVGLMNCLLRTEFINLQGDHLTKGAIAEQFVAQHLAYLEGPNLTPNLTYWLRDKGSQKGEIDFLIQKSNVIIPIEVKSDKSGTLKSLFYFVYDNKWAQAIKVSCHPFSKTLIKHKIHDSVVNIDLIELPIYAVETLLEMQWE